MDFFFQYSELFLHELTGSRQKRLIFKSPQFPPRVSVARKKAKPFSVFKVPPYTVFPDGSFWECAIWQEKSLNIKGGLRRTRPAWIQIPRQTMPPSSLLKLVYLPVTPGLCT